MKINVVRSEFLKAWQMAERSSSSKSTITSLGGVLLTAEENKILLSATDLKTSIRCTAAGVEVLQNGSAVLPVKLLSELFKKAPSDTFTLEVKKEKGVLVAGRNKTRFSTWPAEDFPNLAGSDGAEHLCDIPAPDLLRLLIEGSIASSPTEDFPKYLGVCLFQLKPGVLQVISTDGHRLALSKCPCQGEKPAELLLPVLSLRELQRLLSGLEEGVLVHIVYDGSLVWFQMGEIEFSARRVESSFPNYERLLNPDLTTTMLIQRDEFLSALERIDVIVRSHTRIVIMHLSPGEPLKLTGRAPEMGTVVEMLDAAVSGEAMQVGFNVGFMQDGLKSLNFTHVKMSLNGQAGQMSIRREDADDFLYMLMPVKITEQDIIDPDADADADEEENGREAAAAHETEENFSAPAEAKLFQGKVTRKAQEEALESLKALEEISQEGA